MCGGFVAVRSHAGDFRFEQGNSIGQFVMRITVERLRCQKAGHIACTARALVKFHRASLCDRLSLAVNRLRGYLALLTVYEFAAAVGCVAPVQGGMA